MNITTNLFHVPFTLCSRTEIVQEILSRVEEKEKGKEKGLQIISTPNTEHVVLAQKGSEFQKTLALFDWCVPDSAGIVWASRMLSPQGEKIQERIPGRLLMLDIVKKLHKKEVLLLGSSLAVLQAAAQKLQKEYPSCTFTVDPGAKDIVHETKEERDHVHFLIRRLQPFAVFVAYGAPWQERWVVENRQMMGKAGVRIAMVVGGSFEVLAGMIPEAPLLVQKLGFEWLWRLLQEPWRWRRQLALPKFVWMVVKKKRSKV
jgi:N-acetylglucosaminyldiphosphoundecaprenol N-acetyl-beta-D-mannosaminyltransferase